MTEKEKMLAGMVYSAVDEQLLEELNAVKEVIHKYNSLSPADAANRASLSSHSLSYTPLLISATILDIFSDIVIIDGFLRVQRKFNRVPHRSTRW